jgi:SAM-dependent methyltransferase
LAIEHLRPVLERPGALVADFGCSSGWLIEDINTQFPKIGIIGFDSILSGLEWIRGRMPHVPLIQGDLLRNPFPTNGLDGFVTLNVLEHIEDDEAALDQLCRTLAPGGLGFVMVAASPRLYDFYDSLARHFRRYTMDDLRRKLGRVGFQILRSQYLGSSLFIPFAATKKLMHWRFGKEPPEVQWRIMLEEIRRTRSLGVGSVILAAEQWLGKVLPFPFGIRAYALVTK